MIAGKLGKTTKIMARKTMIECVESQTARKFFEENHIQGFVGGIEYIALKTGDEIVAMMSFGRPRFNKSYDYELLRFANKLSTTVVGGFSKLLKHFMSRNSGTIVSYADRSRSNGNVYIKNGFELVSTTEPGYGYTDGECLYSRHEFQKHKLESKLKVYDAGLTEEENMFANKYRKYFDCGQLVFQIG